MTRRVNLERLVALANLDGAINSKFSDPSKLVPRPDIVGEFFPSGMQPSLTLLSKMKGYRAETLAMNCLTGSRGIIVGLPDSNEMN